MAATDIGMYGQPIAEGAGPGSLLYVGGVGGGAEVGALLGVSTPAGPAPGGLTMTGAVGLGALSEFAPAGGVRGWQVAVSPGASVQPYLVAAAFVLGAPPLLAGACAVRAQAGAGYLRIWLVDSTETPVDPANVLGVANGNLVSFRASNGGPR